MLAMRALRHFAPAVLFLLAETVAFPAAAQTFAEALAAYNRGDYATAYRGFRRNAEGGDARAQNNLGYMYSNAKGIPRNFPEAIRWYRRAADQGHAQAQLNLGLMYANGKGVRQDYRAAERWLRRAATQGIAAAQYNLGIIYSGTKGIPRNDTEAVQWYRRAAGQGHAGAQVNLGFMYAKGRGLRRDYRAAARWYRRAARQGHARAQYLLGFMYRNARGVPRNYAEAARWYRRAARQGYALAQANLAVMYENAAGVPRDLVQAHKWFNLAASRFTASEKRLRAVAIRNRNRVAQRMTAGALARAKQMARLWRPSTGTARRAPSPADDPVRRRRIATLQRALVRLGYDPGPADGVLGRNTRAAIRAFQASAGLPVDGRVTKQLTGAMIAALRNAGNPGRTRRSLKMAGTGSGFRVSASGHILTNAHVVRGCAEVRVPPASHARSRRVTVAARDDRADLALLKGRAGSPSAAFRQGRGIRPAASVIVAGYPLHGVLATRLNVSTGIVSALAGPGNNRRMIQISAPVQKGNSGGPVLDSAGNVVGVVVSKLDALRIARATGDIPQNVNFAVSAGTARAFLDSEGIAYATAPSDKPRAPEDVAAAARKFTVLVECWK